MAGLRFYYNKTACGEGEGARAHLLFLVTFLHRLIEGWTPGPTGLLFVKLPGPLSAFLAYFGEELDAILLEGGMATTSSGLSRCNFTLRLLIPLFRAHPSPVPS